MRIEELSVGDWVLVKGEVANIWCLGVTPYGFAVEVSTNNASRKFTVRLEVVKPIPLTPEILEKNGLCVVEEDADFSEYELFGSENFSIFHIKGTLHYRLETPQASVVCWYVHQLQHALRLAGIGKEIEL